MSESLPGTCDCPQGRPLTSHAKALAAIHTAVLLLLCLHSPTFALLSAEGGLPLQELCTAERTWAVSLQFGRCCAALRACILALSGSRKSYVKGWQLTLQSPMVSRRRSSTRIVKRDSLARMNSLGPISRRGSLVGPDGLPRSPTKGPRDDGPGGLTTSSRPPAGPIIREERSQEGGPEVPREERSPTKLAGSGAGRSPQAREVEMLTPSKSSAGREAFYHN